MNISRRQSHDIPALNTSSLPDLIFTVLFFFMIVTHMRKHEVTVSYQMPVGRELSTVASKRGVIDLYVGWPSAVSSGNSREVALQLDDTTISPDNLSAAVAERLAEFSEVDREQVIVALKADIDTPMRIINEVKLALRKAGALRVMYSAKETEGSKK